MQTPTFDLRSFRSIPLFLKVPIAIFKIIYKKIRDIFMEDHLLDL